MLIKASLGKIYNTIQSYGRLTHQVAMLRVFRQILHDPAAKKAKHLVELFGFAKFMTRKFFEDLSRNPLLIVEALFWKDLKEAIDVTEGTCQTTFQRCSIDPSGFDFGI